MNILFATDKGYLPHVVQCIRSFVRFPREDGYHVYILHSDLTEADTQPLEHTFSGAVRFHFVYVDPKGLLSFPESDRYPGQIYYRLFAAFLLPPEVERILYLDGDITIINPLEELYSMDFAGKDILACTHIRKFLNKMNRMRLGIREARPYINSGVMLMNLKALREHQDPREIVQYVQRHKNVMTLPDQDIIIGLYGGRVGLIDTMRYNLSDRILSIYNTEHPTDRKDLDWVRENAVVIHYCSRKKPWQDDYKGVLDVFYREIEASGFGS